jgi:outer membrane immunogenic protein
MKRNFAMLAAAVTFAALPTFAFAADAIDEVPAAPEAPAYEEPAAGGWAGSYAGVYAGHGWAEHAGVASKGFNGGVFGGYNLQSDSIVYGGEADLGYSASKGAAAGTSVKHGLNGALRARAGVDLGPALVYGAAGVAATRGKLAVGAADDTQTHVGWTAGAGIDAKITGNVIGRIEYRHNDYGKQDYNVGGGASAKLTENEIRIGAGLKF